MKPNEQLIKRGGYWVGWEEQGKEVQRVNCDVEHKKNGRDKLDFLAVVLLRL